MHAKLKYLVNGQVSNSIAILEKVKASTEGYVNNTGKNLGKMEGTVTGLTDRMVDVDSNLNYMLGQLSLVVQEFNTVNISCHVMLRHSRLRQFLIKFQAPETKPTQS